MDTYRILGVVVCAVWIRIGLSGAAGQDMRRAPASDFLIRPGVCICVCMYVLDENARYAGHMQIQMRNANAKMQMQNANAKAQTQMQHANVHAKKSQGGFARPAKAIYINMEHASAKIQILKCT